MYLYYNKIVNAEFTAWFFKVITSVWWKQFNYFENKNKRSEHTLETGV